MNDILTTAYSVFQQIGILPVLIAIYIVGGYIFWRWSTMANKNRHSIFDLWVFSTIVMVIWARLTYIFSNMDAFTKLPWTILPYERYGDEIFLFRTLPWKYFSVWDGNFLFSGLAVGFLFFAANYAVFVKKWRWKDMYKPVFMTLFFMLSAMLVADGLWIQSDQVTVLSLALFGIFALFCIEDKVMSVLKKNNVIGEVVFAVSSGLLTGYLFFTADITQIDKVNIAVLVLYLLFVTVMYLVDLRRADSEVTPVYVGFKKSQIVPNKPIKIKHDN